MLFTFAALAVALLQFAATCVATEAFFATAIVTNANNQSALECWQLDANVSISTAAAAVGATTLQLGNTANMTYYVFPPNYYGEIHNAPYPQ